MTRPADHPPVASGRIGLLLVNLGSPDAPTTSAVKRYLAEFLSDPRVVEIPPILWKPILHGIILNSRPRLSAAAYREIWTDDGAPLIAITKKQADALQARFGSRVMVDWAMRYGSPAIADRLDALKTQGCDRILIAPLYPQYSGATTATVNDAVFQSLGTMRWQPALRTLPPYHDDPAYIDALASEIRDGLAALDFTPEAIVASFHSMPERTLLKGDPYHCQCQKTARLLGDALGRPLTIAFQSRLGRAKWLGPATDATLAGLPGAGIKKVAVVTPGFSADNLETLEEIAIRGRETFVEAGGTDFAYLPCLNDSAAGIDMLTALLSRQLEGW
jgi:protoporphyrin/coproporphyrin ferrochelatase